VRRWSAPQRHGGPATLDDPADRVVAGLLVALGFAADVDAVESPARQTWEFHDRVSAPHGRTTTCATRRHLPVRR
jgi:hypothetical protein